MVCISSATLARIQAQITVKEAQLAVANEAYLKALGSADTESYTFDSKEGKQATTLRSPSVISNEIKKIEAELNRLYNRLSGTGIVNMNLRR